MTLTALERDVLEALWTQYRDGDDVFVIAHPKRSHAMTEMQSYAARSFLFAYADTLDPQQLSRARQLLSATKKAVAQEGPAWIKGTALDQVRSRERVDAFPNTFAMVAEDAIRFALLANEPAWLRYADQLLSVLPHYYDPKTNRVAGGSVAGAPPVFDDVISTHLAAIPLLMRAHASKGPKGAGASLALAEQFLAPRLSPADPLRFPAGSGMAWHQKRAADGSVSQKVHWHHVAYVSRALQVHHKRTASAASRDLFLRSLEGLLSARSSDGWFPRAQLEGARARFARLLRADKDVATTAQAISLLKDAHTLTREQRYHDLAASSLAALAASAKPATSPAADGRPVSLRLPAEPSPPKDSDAYANCWDLCFFSWAARELRCPFPYATIPLAPRGELSLWTNEGDLLALSFTRRGSSVSAALTNNSRIPRTLVLRALAPADARHAAIASKAAFTHTLAAGRADIQADYAPGETKRFEMTFQ